MKEEISMINTAKPINQRNYNTIMFNSTTSNDAAASAALASMNEEERLLAFVSVLVADEKSQTTVCGPSDDMAA